MAAQALFFNRSAFSSSIAPASIAKCRSSSIPSMRLATISGVRRCPGEVDACDRNSGLIALEDLGDLHLQHVIRNAANNEEILNHYKAVIDRLILMGIEGEKEFDPSYTFQTPYYDQGLILEKECRYFVEAFVNGYKGQEIRFDDLKEEFEILATRALGSRYKGFLPRDFQFVKCLC